MRIIAFALVSFVLVSHAALPQPSDLASRVDAAEQRWKHAGPRSYEYTFTYSAAHVVVDCAGGSFRVRVVNGLVVSAPNCRVLRESYSTVPQLFTFVRQLLAQKARHIEVTFDPELGYPTSLGVDGRENAGDDGFYFEVSSFVQVYTFE